MKGQFDHSVNCDGVDEFLKVVKKILSNLGMAGNSGHVYIMSNEKDPVILATIKKAGYKLLSFIKNDLEKKLKKPLDSFHEFLIDILIGCHAKAYVDFGFSNSKCLMELCRHFYAKTPYATSHDGNDIQWVNSKSEKVHSICS